MELTTHQYDEITEIQYNLDASEHDEAIGKLGDEQLVALRQGCLASVERQRELLAGIDQALHARGVS